MSIAPTAEPFYADATPQREDGQRIGVLLVHGFTGSPASVVPWGRAMAGHGYGVAVPRLPGHGTTWQELNRTRLGRLVRRGGACLRQAARQLRPGRRGRAVDGRRSGAAAGGRPGTGRRRHRGGQRGGRHRAQGRARPAGAQARRARLPRHRRRHQEAGRGGARLHQDPAAGRALDDPAPGRTCARTCRRSPSRCCSSSPRRTTWWTPSSLQAVRAAVSSRDLTERMLENSYHVATLDNDAPVIFEESAQFVRRVTGP